MLYACDKNDDIDVPQTAGVAFQYSGDENVSDNQILVYDVNNSNEYLGSFTQTSLELKPGRYHFIAVGNGTELIETPEDYEKARIVQSKTADSKSFVASQILDFPVDTDVAFEMEQVNGGIQIKSIDTKSVGVDSIRVTVENLYDYYQLHNSMVRGNMGIKIQKTFPANDGGLGFDETVYVFPGNIGAEVSLDYYVGGEIVGTRKLGDVIVEEGKASVNEILFADDVVLGVKIEDAIFLEKLKEVLPEDAFFMDQVLPEHESVKNLKELIIPEAGIKNLAGIEAFTSLEILDCKNNKVGALNLSALTYLKELNCSWCNLSSLDISGCTQLEKLNCEANMSVEEYDLSNLTQLKWLNCSLSRGITSLDVSNCTQLTYLEAVSCKYTELDLRGLDQLEILLCNANFNMTSLTVTGCVSLKNLVCKDAGITSLDASDCSNLEVLHCQTNNSMEELKISEEASNLKEIYAQGRASYTDIIGLSATAHLSLKKLYIGESALCGENIKKFHLEGNWIEMKWGVSSGEYLNDYTSESCQ